MAEDMAASALAKVVNSYRIETTNTITRETVKFEKTVNDAIKEILQQTHEKYTKEASERTKRLEETQSLLATLNVNLDEQSDRIRQLERSLEASLRNQATTPIAVESRAHVTGPGPSIIDTDIRSDATTVVPPSSSPTPAPSNKSGPVPFAIHQNLQLQFESISSKYNKCKESEKKLKEQIGRLNADFKHSRGKFNKYKDDTMKVKDLTTQNQDLTFEREDLKFKLEIVGASLKAKQHCLQGMQASLKNLAKRYTENQKRLLNWNDTYTKELQRSRDEAAFLPLTVGQDLSNVLEKMLTAVTAQCQPEAVERFPSKSATSDTSGPGIQPPSSNFTTPTKRRKFASELGSSVRSSTRKHFFSQGQEQYDSDQTSDGEFISALANFSPTSRAIGRAPGPETCVALFNAETQLTLPAPIRAMDEVSQYVSGTMEAPVHIKSESESSSVDPFQKRGYYDLGDEEDNLDLDDIPPVHAESAQLVSKPRKRARLIMERINDVPQDSGVNQLKKRLSALPEMTEDELENTCHESPNMPAVEEPEMFINSSLQKDEDDSMANVKTEPIEQIREEQKQEDGKVQEAGLVVFGDAGVQNQAVNVPADRTRGRMTRSSKSVGPLIASDSTISFVPQNILTEITNVNPKVHLLGQAALKKFNNMTSTPASKLKQSILTPKTAPARTTTSLVRTYGSSVKRKKSGTYEEHRKRIEAGKEMFAEDGARAASQHFKLDDNKQSKTNRLAKLLETQHGSQGLPITPTSRPSSESSFEESDSDTTLVNTPAVSKSSTKIKDIDIDDFRVNPAQNGGVGHAYTEVVRKNALKACLPSCTKECCEDLMNGKLLYLMGPGAPKRKVAAFRSSQASSDSSQDVVDELQKREKDKQKALEMMKGRHKTTFGGRAKEYPGLWDSGFPDTQTVGERNLLAAKERKVRAQARANDPRWEKR